MRALEAPAHGKINLALYVLGRRGDGYHEIATVLQAVDLRDTLRFSTAASGLTLACSDPSLPTDDRNLVVQAVLRLEAESGLKLPLSIRLDKKLPVGAGLGGGSSDAAATLWAVNELFDLGLDAERLSALGADLGSDVPFFLSSGQCLGEGRGERLTPLDWPVNYSLLIAFPGFGIPAREAYARTRMSLTNPLADCRFHRQLTSAQFWGQIGLHDNDLASGITEAFPVVARGIEAMRSLGACHAGMTGSGSAVFGLFAPPAEAQEQLRRWPLRGAWAVWPARPHRTPGRPLPATGRAAPGG